jgi:hypothetical protein
MPAKVLTDAAGTAEARVDRVMTTTGVAKTGINGATANTKAGVGGVPTATRASVAGINRRMTAADRNEVSKTCFHFLLLFIEGEKVYKMGASCKAWRCLT